MTKYRGLLIDLDGTLYEYERCNRLATVAVVDELSAITGREKSDILRFFNESRDQVKRYTEGTASSHSRLLYIQRLVERLFCRSDLDLVVRLHDLFWNSYVNNIILYDGVLDFLQYVKSQGVETAVVTDLTADIQIKKLRGISVNSYIDFLVTSEEAGRDKPYKSIFEIALRKLSLPKSVVIMLGDNPDTDIRGALDFGINAINVNKGSFKDGKLKEYF